jgi:hypothetical protein
VEGKPGTQLCEGPGRVETILLMFLSSGSGFTEM